MRLLAVVALAAILLLGLSGCNIFIGGGGGATSLTATVGRGGSLATQMLNPGEYVWYQIALPQTSPTVQAAYFEITKQLNLSLYESNKITLYGSSSSAGYFARGTLGLASLQGSTGAVKQQDIVTQPICAGSCVIHPANASTFWVRVANQTPSTQTFSLYAYVKDYQDSGETANNTLGGATSLGSGANFHAALESIGDLDYYTFQTSGYFQLTGCTSMDFQAVIHLSGGGTQTLNVNDSAVLVGANDYVVVSSASADYAAQASACSYYASLQ